MNRLLPALLLFLAAVASPLRAEPVPADFAYGLSLPVDGEVPLYEVSLPVEVYQKAVRAGLGDLCVFNGLNEPVPFAVQPPVKKTTETSVSANVPFFPLPEEQSRRTEGLSLQIKRDRSGAIIDMTTDPEVEKTDQTTAAYLLDASSFERVLSELQLEWEPTEEGFAGKVSVESSDDLDRWVPRASDVTIADLRYGEHRLVQQKVPLGGFKAKYLRLSWPKTVQAIRLTAVTLRYIEEQIDRPWLWLPVDVTPDPDKPGEYRFDTQGRLPVFGMRVDLPQVNTLASVSFLSRPAEKDTWRSRGSMTVYNLRVRGEELKSGNLGVENTTDRYWMMRVEQGGSGLGRGAVRIQVGWVPQKLLFVARGSGPFTLAFGSGRTGSQILQTEDLLKRFMARDRKELAREIEPGRMVTLAGDAALELPSPPIPWKQWILWFVLLSGVILLGFMAMRLFRQMRDTP